MAIKRYKPTTPGRRKASVLDFSALSKKRPESSLTTSLKSKGGRNVSGKITVRHRGGGHKRRYRLVDFKQMRYDMPATIAALEYDPNRGANIALIEYTDGEKAYILAAEGMAPGASVMSSQKFIEPVIGARMPLMHIPAGLNVYNVELTSGGGGCIVRGAGTAAQLQTVEGKYAQLKLPSGEVRFVPKECMASVGVVGNADRKLVRLGKAGRMRHRGFRPTVRGKAMNPVDHPHGGGEGNSPVGLKSGPKTPWGKLARGVKTRKPSRASQKLIVKHRNSKKR